MRKFIRKILSVVTQLPMVNDALTNMVVAQQRRLNQNTNTLHTPWVYCDKFEVNNRVKYIQSVFQDYLSKSDLTLADLQGKRILEVGPGETLGVAILLLAHGAEQVVCVDRFRSLLNDQNLILVYRELVQQLDQAAKSRVQDLFQWQDDQIQYNQNRLTYLNKPIDQVQENFPAEYFDIIISRAVLEHVYHIDESMDAMHTLLKPGGYALHEIDFRDHRIFTKYCLHPLTLLTIPTPTWNEISSNIGSPNRRLYSYFKSFFLERNYRLHTIILENFNAEFQSILIPEEQYNPESGLDPKWIRKNSSKIQIEHNRMDLAVAVAFYSAQKQK